MEPLVAEHVSRQFGGLKAVRDVCFSMQPGQRRALIGPNGAGKPTLLKEWRLWDRRDELTRNLSYGDQRELEILMALAGRPRLLLLDEPTAGLSAAETRLVEAIIRGLPRDMTILLIEHDLDIAFELA